MVGFSDSKLIAEFDPARTQPFRRQGKGLVRLVREYPDDGQVHVIAPWTVVHGGRREVEAYAKRSDADQVRLLDGFTWEQAAKDQAAAARRRAKRGA